jgi:hypothetical protein
VDGLSDGALKNRLVKVVATALGRVAVHVDPGGRKDPLPGPVAAGAWVLPGEGVGELTQPAPLTRSA